MNDDLTHRTDPDDPALIALFRAGDSSAASEAEAKYGKMLHGIAAGILRDERDCEECMNDLWLALYGGLPDEFESSFRAYAARLMRNIAVNRYHSQTRKKRAEDAHALCLDELAEAVPGGAAADEEFFRGEFARLINAFVRGLDKQDRHIFIARYYESRTAREIAQEIGITESGVFKALARQRKKLKTFLERNGYEL